MNARKFLWLNLVSAALWSCLFACIGFGASKLFAQLVDDLHRYEWWIAGALLLIALAALGWHLGRPRRRPPESAS